LIVDAAADLFISEGYARTTIRAIAEGAGVVPDTVYASFGSKVRVLTAVIDARLAPSGAENVMDRPEALAVRDDPDQRSQLHRFAQDIAAISTRVRPIYEVLRTASASEPEVGEVFAEMEAHRLTNMGRLATWLARHGHLRVDEDRAAEIIWVLASPDVARMLCDVRGWSEADHAAWLESTLTCALLGDGKSAAQKRHTNERGS
jgi:AcrR family transcriptional regulator